MNGFTQQQKVDFDKVSENFNDALVMSGLVSQYTIAEQEAERSGDEVWRNMPYIAKSYDGRDATANFGETVQRSVPGRIDIAKHTTWQLSAKERRDGKQVNLLKDAGEQKLASDINVSLLDTACEMGTIFLARPNAPEGYDDVAEMEAMMNEVGIGNVDRNLALSTRDYNGMASNLAARQTLNKMPTAAYRKSYVGEVAGFETHKLDYGYRLAASTATPTIAAADQFYTPTATKQQPDGTYAKTDSRFQTITIAAGAGLKRGDAFTIPGVNSVHHITKRDTGELKTFRVSQVNSATEIVISPPIISGQGATLGEEIYQNVTDTPANGAAINILNTVTGSVNPFWCKDAIELIPGTYVVPSDGVAVMTSTVDQGVQLTMTKWIDGFTLDEKFRLDVSWGTLMAQPEMAGGSMFRQT